MDLQERIIAFAELGEGLRNALDGESSRYSSRLTHLTEIQQIKNAWFTPANVIWLSDQLPVN